MCSSLIESAISRSSCDIYIGTTFHAPWNWSMVDRIGLAQSNFLVVKSSIFSRQNSSWLIWNYLKNNFTFFPRKKISNFFKVEKNECFVTKIALKMLVHFIAFKGLKIPTVCLRVRLIDAFDWLFTSQVTYLHNILRFWVSWMIK